MDANQTIQKYYDSLELNESTLEIFDENDIIAEGFGLYPQIHSTIRIHWVAVKGAVDDWVIVYLKKSETTEKIKKSGDKMFTRSLIKALVNCTEDALSLYRF